MDDTVPWRACRRAIHPAPIPPQRCPDAGPALAQHHEAGGDRDTTAVLALGTRDDSSMSRLRAGEATSLVLLTATTLGLASCPVTEPLEIPATRDAVRDDVFGDYGFPQMLLRIGWAPVNADPLPSTPRMPLSAVVDWAG